MAKPGRAGLANTGAQVTTAAAEVQPDAGRRWPWSGLRFGYRNLQTIARVPSPTRLTSGAVVIRSNPPASACSLSASRAQKMPVRRAAARADALDGGRDRRRWPDGRDRLRCVRLLIDHLKSDLRRLDALADE